VFSFLNPLVGGLKVPSLQKPSQDLHIGTEWHRGSQQAASVLVVTEKQKDIVCQINNTLTLAKGGSSL